MKKEIDIYLPIFTGFYNTIHDMNDDEIIDDFLTSIQYDDETGYSETLSKDDFDKVKEMGSSDYSDAYDVFWKYYDINFEKYRTDYASTYVDEFNKEFKKDLESIWIYDIKFTKVYSPTYYNYGNDEIDVTSKYDIKLILEFLKDNAEAFQKYIKEHNTGYDWFIPFGTNNIEDYYDKKEFEAFELTQIMDFYIKEILDFSSDDVISLHYDTMEDINIYEYVETAKKD